jgi:hypothetical protein
MCHVPHGVCRESERRTDDLKKSSSSGSGRMEKGAVNVAGDWTGGLQEPNGLKYPHRSRSWRVTADAMANRRDQRDARVKLVMERLCMDTDVAKQTELGRYSVGGWARPVWARGDLAPKRSAACAARGIANRLKHRGSSFRTREPRCDAENAMLGKPPSPVMSLARGRVLVVVRARESRAHGEGGQ